MVSYTMTQKFAGKLCQVTLTEEPTLYAVGTPEAAPTYDPKTGKGILALSCTDGDAFLYHVAESAAIVTGSGTAVLNNDFSLWSL